MKRSRACAHAPLSKAMVTMADNCVGLLEGMRLNSKYDGSHQDIQDQCMMMNMMGLTLVGLTRSSGWQMRPLG